MPDTGGRAAALMLAPEPPYPLTGGGSFRTASLAEFLAARYDLDLVLFQERGAGDFLSALPRGRFRNIDVLELPAHSRRGSARALRNVRRWLNGIPPLIDRFAGFESALAAILESRQYEIAVAEHFWCAPYHPVLARSAGRVLLNLHNVESVLYARYAATEGRLQRTFHRGFERANRELERTWLPCYSLVLAASQIDARRAKSVARSARVSIYPNALPLRPRPRVREDHVLAFSGNLAYPPNISAVRWFREHVWPRLTSQWPKLEWRIIGKNPAAVEQYLAGDQRIVLTGPVDDALAQLAAAQVVIAPLLSGSGTRIKILEAWAAARPVVATSVGAEGLSCRDGEHLWICDDPATFATKVSTLLESEPLRARFGEAGRRLFEARYSWEAAHRMLETALAEPMIRESRIYLP